MAGKLETRELTEAEMEEQWSVFTRAMRTIFLKFWRAVPDGRYFRESWAISTAQVGQLESLNQTYEKWLGFASGLKGKIVDVSGYYDRMTHDDLESLRFLYMRRQARFEVYKDKDRPGGSINNVSFRERERLEMETRRHKRALFGRGDCMVIADLLSELRQS